MARGVRILMRLIFFIFVAWTASMVSLLFSELLFAIGMCSLIVFSVGGFQYIDRVTRYKDPEKYQERVMEWLNKPLPEMEPKVDWRKFEHKVEKYLKENDVGAPIDPDSLIWHMKSKWTTYMYICKTPGCFKYGKNDDYMCDKHTNWWHKW